MSLERERFLALLLDCLAPLIGRPALLLDVAPSDRVTPLLAALRPRLRIGLDFDPGADGRLVDLQASVAAIPLVDASVDLMVCYHVLEHVPDDAAAIAEMARVLAPGGIAVVEVPWRPDVPTDEDPDASREERIRRFGQADHVRYYGSDFEARLESGGLRVRSVTPVSLLGPTACAYFHLNPVETVWLLSPGHLPDVLRHQGSGVLSGAFTALLDTVAGHPAELRARDAEWRARVTAAEQHWLLRGYRRLRRPAVRFLGRR